MKRLFVFVLLVLIAFPLTDALGERAKGRHVVMIDAAHGGSDPGVTVSDKESEKNISLAISQLMKRELDKTTNIDAQLTRAADKDVSFAERKEIVKKAKPEAFVSIHVNAGFSKNSTGFELYFPGFKQAPEQGDSKEILKDMARNKYLNDSVKLAQLIQKNMDKVFPRKSRGLRDAMMLSLEGLPVPAVIVEIGFASNPEDRKKITDAKTQEAIAHALCQSIRDFF